MIDCLHTLSTGTAVCDDEEEEEEEEGDCAGV